MLSYLQPQLTSESMLGICSTSTDDIEKSTYPNEDDHESIFNPASAAIISASTSSSSSSSRIPYPHPHQLRSPVPFVYGHTPTPTYGFGFGFYEDMSTFAGKLFT